MTAVVIIMGVIVVFAGAWVWWIDNRPAKENNDVGSDTGMNANQMQESASSLDTKDPQKKIKKNTRGNL